MANGIEKDARLLEMQSFTAARQSAARVRDAITQGLKKGRVPNVEKIMVGDLLGPLTKATAVAHLAGQRRSRLLAGRREAMALAFDPDQSRDEGGQWTSGGSRVIRFDVFDSVLKVLKAQGSADYEKLQRKYKTQALKVLKESSRAVEKKLRAKVSELIAEGAHVRDAVAGMAKTFDKLGIGARSDSQLETIFRTQLQIAQNAGRWQEDQEEEIDEILWGYKYVTVGDDRVRDEHAVLDGTTLPKDDPFWETYWPPNGWNCRCQVIPIFEPRKVHRPKDPPPPDEGFRFNPGEVFQLSHVVSLAFDPNQARDERGRWTDGGGSGGSGGKESKEDKRARAEEQYRRIHGAKPSTVIKELQRYGGYTKERAEKTVEKELRRIEERDVGVKGRQFKEGRKWAKSLSEEERNLVENWTGEGSSRYRELDARGSSNKELAELKRTFAAAPVYKGVAYRGMVLSDKEVNQFRVGRKVGINGMSSFSTKERVALDFSSGRGYDRDDGIKVLLKARIKDGRDIRAVNRYEGEIVVRRETYVVKDAYFAKGRYVVELH